jgi:hypothetical protein
MLAVPLIVAIALGWTVLHLLLPVRSGWAGLLFSSTLAAALGVGLTSTIYFLLLAAGAAGRGMVVASDLALLLAAAVIAYRRRSAGKKEQAAADDQAVAAHPWEWLAGLTLAAGVAVAGFAFFDYAARNPCGQWDAWSIWNLRAKFLLTGETWRNAYSPLLHRTHPDYPLLLSAFIARSWKYLGAGTPASVPITVACLFQVAVIGLLVSTTALLRSRGAGLLAGLVLVATASFLRQGPWQYADMPLSLYVLGAVALLLLASAPGPARTPALALAGLFAAFAAWTKNEGLLFLVVALTVLFFVEGFTGGWKRALAETGWFLLGALPILSVTLYFKFALAPAADPLVAQPVAGALARLQDPGRYATIARAFWSETLMLGDGWRHPAVALGILAAVLRFRVAPGQRKWTIFTGTTVVLVLAGYFCAYVITPASLEWHLSTSLGRLYMHLWPSVLLLFFVALRRPEDTAVVHGIGIRSAGGGKKRGRTKSG